MRFVLTSIYVLCNVLLACSSVMSFVLCHDCKFLINLLASNLIFVCSASFYQNNVEDNYNINGMFFIMLFSMVAILFILLPMKLLIFYEFGYIVYIVVKNLNLKSINHLRSILCCFSCCSCIL